FLFAHYLTWFTAVKNTQIASAAVLSSLQPLIVLVISLFVFKHHTSIRAIIGIVVAIVGGSIVAGFDYSFSPEYFYGDIMAILSGVGIAIYFSIGSAIRARMPANLYVLIVFGSAWVCFAAGMVLTGTPFTAYPASDYFYLLLMTIFCQLGAHAVFNWSMGYVKPLYVSTWVTGEIIFASNLAIIFLKEIPSFWQGLGGVIVMGGLLYYNYNENHELKNINFEEGK
ncbi:MAG: DMT family transporter, partial [Anaerovoracaceae bacterium]